MSRKPTGDLGKRSDGENLNISPRLNSEGNSSKNPSGPIKQAINAFEKLQPIGEKPISSELPNGMANFLVEMQNRNPAFGTAICPLLDAATNATSEVSKEKKESSSQPLSLLKQQVRIRKRKHQ